MFSVSAWKQHMWPQVYMSSSLQAWDDLSVDIALMCVWPFILHMLTFGQRWSTRVRLDFMCLTVRATCGCRSGHTSRGADWLLPAVCCGDCVINAQSHRVFSRSRLPLMFYWLWPWKGPSNEEQDAGGGGGEVRSGREESFCRAREEDREREREKGRKAPGSGHIYRRIGQFSVHTKTQQLCGDFFLHALSIFSPPTEITVFSCSAHYPSNRCYFCLVLTGSEGQTDACCKENRLFFFCLVVEVCMQGLGMTMSTWRGLKCLMEFFFKQ